MCQSGLTDRISVIRRHVYRGLRKTDHQGESERNEKEDQQVQHRRQDDEPLAVALQPLAARMPRARAVPSVRGRRLPGPRHSCVDCLKRGFAQEKPVPPRRSAARARSTRSRQRQRLIDACISALHIYGPSKRRSKKWWRSRKCPLALSDSTSTPKRRCWSPPCSSSPRNSRNRSWCRSPICDRGRSRRSSGWWTFISTRTSPAPAKSPSGMHFGAKPARGRNTTTFAARRTRALRSWCAT